ncbi:oxygenase MpaB family protein [Rhodococcus sp. HNM0569]|uniref:oxygenase MpaB family protein n=1 Tax=Rhodococcus sp. HNM0569 TaxID=2716340 RepID=UPI001F0F81AD|nr:oxygenase MpaB family protein [Rhodococcus sp. HNM0569]
MEKQVTSIRPEAPSVWRKSAWRERIESLDPVADCHEIHRIMAGFEFPWDYQRSLEFALFKTYCVPSISELLDKTGEFEHRPQKRYDDTALLMAEMVEHGFDSPRGKDSLRVVNRMHGKYTISNDDMLYVLSTFVYEPLDWIDAYGWRRLTPHERAAAFHFYTGVGKRMGIKDIPEDFQEFHRFKLNYEREHFRYSESNHRIGVYTTDLFCSWFPAPLRPLVSIGVRGLLDDRMLTAFGFEPAPEAVRRAATRGLRLRSAAVRLLPPRRVSNAARDPHNRTYPGYPGSYRPSDLGSDSPPPSWGAPTPSAARIS